MATYSQAVQEDGFIEARNPKKRQRASTGQEPIDSPQRSGEQLTVTIKPIVAKLNGLAIAKEITRIAGGNVKTVKKRGNCLVVHTHNQRQAAQITDAVKFSNIDVSITLGKPDGPQRKVLSWEYPMTFLTRKSSMRWQNKVSVQQIEFQKK